MHSALLTCYTYKGGDSWRYADIDQGIRVDFGSWVHQAGLKCKLSLAVYIFGYVIREASESRQTFHITFALHCHFDPKRVPALIIASALLSHSSSNHSRRCFATLYSVCVHTNFDIWNICDESMWSNNDTYIKISYICLKTRPVYTCPIWCWRQLMNGFVIQCIYGFLWRIEEYYTLTTTSLYSGTFGDTLWVFLIKKQNQFTEICLWRKQCLAFLTRTILQRWLSSPRGFNWQSMIFDVYIDPNVKNLCAHYQCYTKTNTYCSAKTS